MNKLKAVAVCAMQPAWWAKAPVKRLGSSQFVRLQDVLESASPPKLSPRVPLTQLKKLRPILAKAASVATCYDAAAYARQSDPLHGHCYVTALLVRQRFGGALVKGTVDGVSHYWNLLPNGKQVDLTSSQFGGDGWNPLIEAVYLLRPEAAQEQNSRFIKFKRAVEQNEKAPQ